MKYAVATLLATTSAIAIRSESAKAAAATCSSNFERMTAQKDYTLASSFVTKNMKDGKFEDPSFTADDTSLYNEINTKDPQYNQQVQAFKGVENGRHGIVWKRPTEILTGGEQPSLWGDEGISVKISQQGYLGDCWFLSSASALAGYPERVKAMFPGQDKYPADGAFQVRLFVKGEPVNVVVDDRLPVHNYSNAMGYVQNYPPIANGPSKANAWWLAILEKAMAKLNVNYSGLNSGMIGQAQRYMTGMPTSTIRSGASTSDEELWDAITSNLKNDYNMGAACQVSHNHMVSGHAYGVIGALELEGGAHHGQKLIKMRNPWGSNEYNGPWYQGDSEWTAEYRKQAEGYAATNIGEFYIALSQWQTDYTSLITNYFNDDWKISTAGTTTWSKTWGQLNNWQTVHNEKAQEVIFECLQVESRLFPSDTCKTDNTPQQMQFYLYDTHMSRQGTVGKCDGDSLVFKNLPAGTYQLRTINFTGSGSGDMKMRAFTPDAELEMTQQKGNNYVYKY